MCACEVPSDVESSGEIDPTDRRWHVSQGAGMTTSLLLLLHLYEDILINMRRTNTTTVQTFSLPFPNAATFDFSDKTYITITIPERSKWHMPWHWHNTALDGKSIRHIRGHLFISHGPISEDSGTVSPTSQYFNGSGPGCRRLIFDITELVSRKSQDKKLLQVEYEANQVLHRNICSAILDRDIYSKLESTPIWVSALFALSSRGLKHRLLDYMLAIQLDMIYYHHDFRLYHGSIMFQLPWMLLSWGQSKPPRWTLVANIWSIFFFSKVVMISNYAFGRLLLGMKGEYSEYTPPSLPAKVE